VSRYQKGKTNLDYTEARDGATTANQQRQSTEGKTMKMHCNYSSKVWPTCSEVPAPMSSPSDWATRHVCVDNVMNMKKRRKSFGWLVIQ